MAANGNGNGTASREPSTMMPAFDPRPASNAILATSGIPKIFPATASEYATAAYYGDVAKLDAAPNADVYKSGFVYVDGDKKSPAGLFYLKTGKKDAKSLHDKPFTLISLSALQDNSDESTQKFALPALYYARAAGQRDAVLSLHKHAADEQEDVKTNFIHAVKWDQKNSKWVVDGAPLRRSAFEVAIENGFEKGSVADADGCRVCEASTCALM